MDEQNKTVQPEAAAAPESRPLKKPAQAKDEAPRRRVGSFTLGVCLIAAGVFFLCYHFVPGFDWKLALKVAPAAGSCCWAARCCGSPATRAAGSTISGRC